MLIVMVGLPGSGKSSWAEANFRHIVSPDRIRAEEFGAVFEAKIERRVWSRARSRVREHLARHEVVCFDATSVTTKRRAVLGRIAETAGVPAIAVWVRVPEEVAWERNAVGGALLRQLIVASEAVGVWTLQAGVFRENVASIELHRKAGFRVVGRREKLGELKGRWRDVILLERRSETVGAD